MAMSTQTWAEGSRLLALLLVDTIQIMDVGDPVTVGFDVVRELTPVGDPIPGLVQTTTLENAAESSVNSIYSVKVLQGTVLEAGQAIKLITCAQEPSFVGKVLLIDKISQNGLAVIRKGTASDFKQVNQEGKGDLS